MSSSSLPKRTLNALTNGFHIQVMFINQLSKTEEPKATISSRDLAPDSGLPDVLLRHLREKLAKRADSKWAFCFKNCAPVEDSNGLLYYVTLEEANVQKIQVSVPVGSDQKPVEPITLPVLSVYMTVGSPMAPPPKGFAVDWAEKYKPDLSLVDRSGSELGAPALLAHKAEYANEVAWAPGKTDATLPGAAGMLDCVVDLADAEWAKIMMLNKALYAFDVRGQKLEITSARLPAFVLKDPEEMDPFVQPQSPDAETVRAAYLRPFVEIHDTPHIDITEVTSEFQTSLVDNAFSSKSLETMIGGGSPLITASVSAGIKSESSRGSGSSEGGQKKEYHATYNFPRVRLFLDENTLGVSSHCRSALMDLQSAPTLENLRRFQHRFGVIFAQEVILGGRLEATKAADSQSSAGKSSAKDAFKASFGVAVSYGPVSASMNAGYENQTSHATQSDKNQGASAISYTARGGDTLLCVDPAAWAATVAVWRNWRVIQQDEPVTVQDLLGRFKEYEFVPKLFASILETRPPPIISPEPVKQKTFEDRKWTRYSKIQLWTGQDYIPSMAFVVRDGDPDNEGAGPRESLLADYPLLLFNELKYDFPGRDANTVYVDNATGTLGPQTHGMGAYRFSFRKAGRIGRWQPTNGIELVNGDKVTMWCHSIGRGGWTALSNSPSEAYQAQINQVTKEVRFNTENATLSTVVGFEPAVFTMEFI